MDRHPARRTRRGLAVAAVASTVALAGGLWVGDVLGSPASSGTRGSRSTPDASSTSDGSSSTYDDGSSSTYDDGSSSQDSPPFTPSYSPPDASSHAS